MMNFREYFQTILEANAEKRFDFLLKKYLEPIRKYIHTVDNTADDTELDELATQFINYVVFSYDPTNGEYSEWIIKNYLKLSPQEYKRFDEDVYKITEDLEKYHKYKKYFKIAGQEMNNPNTAKLADINQIKGFDDLYQKLKVIEHWIKKSEEDESLKSAEKDAEKVYNSVNYLIIIPKTQEASCAYGRGTRWCTAATGSSNYFNHYNKQGPLYIIIDRKDNEKYQFHFQSEQYMNADDSQVNLKEFFATHTELKSPLIDLAIKNNNINFVLNVDIDMALEKMESFDEPTQEKFVRENSLCAFRLGLKKPDFVNKTQPLFIFENDSVSIRTNKGNFADLAEQFVASSRRGNETETAKEVLGDGLDLYYDHGSSYDSDYWSWLDTKSQLLMKKYIWAAYNVEISNISEAEDLVDEHDDEYIKDLLTRCFDDAGQAAYESEYHKVAINAIFDALGKTFEWRNNTIVFTKYSYKQIQDIFDNFIEHFSEDAIPVSLPHDFLSQLETYLRETDQLTIPDFDRARNNSYPTKKEQGDVFNERFRNDLEIPESQQPELDLSSFKNYFKWTVIK